MRHSRHDASRHGTSSSHNFGWRCFYPPFLSFLSIWIRIIMTNQRKFRKLPSYGWWSWLAFTPSCQPHHDVNLRIKFLGSATVRERGNLHGWFHTLGREILGFTGMVPPGVAASMCEGFRQKVHRTLARARFALEHVKNWGGLGALLEGLTHWFIAL